MAIKCPMWLYASIDIDVATTSYILIHPKRHTRHSISTILPANDTNASKRISKRSTHTQKKFNKPKWTKKILLVFGDQIDPLPARTSIAFIRWLNSQCLMAIDAVQFSCWREKKETFFLSHILDHFKGTNFPRRAFTYCIALEPVKRNVARVCMMFSIFSNYILFVHIFFRFFSSLLSSLVSAKPPHRIT